MLLLGSCGYGGCRAVAGLSIPVVVSIENRPRKTLLIRQKPGSWCLIPIALPGIALGVAWEAADGKGRSSLGWFTFLWEAPQDRWGNDVCRIQPCLNPTQHGLAHCQQSERQFSACVPWSLNTNPRRGTLETRWRAVLFFSLCGMWEFPAQRSSHHVGPPRHNLILFLML